MFFPEGQVRVFVYGAHFAERDRSYRVSVTDGGMLHE